MTPESPACANCSVNNRPLFATRGRGPCCRYCIDTNVDRDPEFTEPAPEPTVRATATGPDGEHLGSWTTSESGEHTVGDPETVPVDLDDYPEQEADGDRAISRDAIAQALCKASPPALDAPWQDLPDADRGDYLTAADAVLAALPAGAVRGSARERHLIGRVVSAEKAAAVNAAAGQRALGELDRLRHLLDERQDESIANIIDGRVERAVMRSDAKTALSRSTQALAEYMRDGSVASVGRDVARPWLHGDSVRHTDDAEAIEPGMDPDRLRALAFAVAASTEAVEATRYIVRDLMERKAYAVQIAGELDDLEQGMDRLDSTERPFGEGLDYLRMHLSRARDIVKELRSGYDHPSHDRGAGVQL